jgi:hypothetical protein
MAVRIVVGMTLLVVGCQGTKPNPGSGSGSATAVAGSAVGGQNAPVPPPIPAPDRLGPGPQLEVVDAEPARADAAPIARFEDEPRDAAWAQKTEGALHADLRGLPAVSGVEVACKTHQCKLTVAPKPNGMVEVAGQIERILAGKARNVIFGRPVPREDGPGEALEVYVIY